MVQGAYQRLQPPVMVLRADSTSLAWGYLADVSRASTILSGAFAFAGGMVESLVETLYPPRQILRFHRIHPSSLPQIARATIR